MEFLKQKVILRTLISFIMPFLIYSLGFLIFKIFDSSATPYFNLWSWIGILVFATVYPVSQISLWLFFAPITCCLKRSIRRNKDSNYKKAFFEKGNFAPIHKEIEYEISDIVMGKVPDDIRGAFVKNGPNNQYSTELGNSHWFEGDSMLDAISIKD